MKKEVAPKAEEEGGESSSSEANGPVAAATCTSDITADRGAAGTSEAGMWELFLLQQDSVFRNLTT